MEGEEASIHDSTFLCSSKVGFMHVPPQGKQQLGVKKQRLKSLLQWLWEAERIADRLTLEQPLQCFARLRVTRRCFFPALLLCLFAPQIKRL